MSSHGLDQVFPALADVLAHEELSSLRSSLTELDLVAGETLITEGTTTDALYLVLEGALEVSVGDGVVVAEVGAGDFLGEVALLSPGPATATVRAIESTGVLVLSGGALDDFEHAHPVGAARLLTELSRTLSRRVRETARALAAAGVTAALPPAAAGDVATVLGGRLADHATDAVTAMLARTATTSEVGAGEVLGTAGERADALLLVLDGELVGRAAGPGTDPVRVITVPTGHLVGAEAFLGTVLGTDLVASTTTTVARLAVSDLHTAATGPDGAVALARLIGGALADTLRALLEALRTVPPAEQPTDRADVAVIGAGPLGIGFAAFLAEARPRTAITLLDRRAQPGYKIGESTLGTTTRWMRHMGLEMPVLRRLFGIKSGIRFWWTGPGDPELHRHVDAGDVDETFQVERRVLETALIELMRRRRGVDVRLGTRVNVPASTFDPDRVALRCEPDDGEAYDLDAALVCDASGPASVLPRRFGAYRRAPERQATFNTNAYYAYFRQRQDVSVPAHWDEPATRHICFPQGWCWFITVISWEASPQENLEAMVRALLDHPVGPDDSYPSRRELEERFGCTSETILSVGFTVRQDRDTALGMSVADRFAHYQQRYPAIGRILEHYELVSSLYAKRQPYAAFQQLAHDATSVAGDGWCAVGDAAGFTNPLFSPGLNYGTGMAFEAARDAARGLSAGDLTRGAFRAYQHYADRLHDVLMAFNDMLYRAFAHPETFERALAMFLYHSASDVLARELYSETDPYVWDLLNSEFTRRVDEVRQVLRNAEERGQDPASVVADVRHITDSYIAELLDRPELSSLDLGPVLREFDAAGQRRPQRYDGPPGPFTASRCGHCRQWYDSSLTRCPVCGTPGS